MTRSLTQPSMFNAAWCTEHLRATMPRQFLVLHSFWALHATPSGFFWSLMTLLQTTQVISSPQA